MPVMIRTKHKLLALIALGLALPAASADDSAQSAKAWSPTAFEASYKVLHGRSHVGTSKMKLSILEDGLYQYQNNVEARGLAKFFVKGKVFGISRFALECGHPRPLDYQSDGPKKDDTQSIAFNYDLDQAFSSYDGVQTVFDLKPETTDMLSMDIALMMRMKNERGLSPIPVVNRNESQVYLFRADGDESIKTDAGEFDTVRVWRQREGSSRRYLLWLAPKLDYLPVRVEQYKNDKVNNTLILISYENQSP